MKKKVLVVAIIIGLLVGIGLVVAYASYSTCPYCGLIGVETGRQKTNMGYICFYQCPNNHVWTSQCW